MRYDVSSKVLMEKCRGEILRRFVGLSVIESTLLEPLPQETVSLRRSDYPVLVKDQAGRERLVILEIQTQWERDVPLRLLEYRCRYLLRYDLEAVSCVLLLRPSPHALDHYTDSEVTFRFRTVRIYDMDARDIIQENVLCLLPFVPLMRHGPEWTEQADRLIYESSLPRRDKGDMLTAMMILSGLVSAQLPQTLLSRRRDIMIESAAYDLIKNEGILEGMEQGLRKGALQTSREDILEVLEERFEVVPKTISSTIHAIDNPSVLKFLHKKSVTASSLDHFKEILERALDA